jgi:sulfite exporter TauE/SafE
MSAISLASVLAASVLGSVHCGAMCGGFVAAYAGDAEQPRGRRLRAHLAYNGARLVTYLALGAAAGFAGKALDLAGRAVGVAHVAAVVAAGVLVLSGLAALRPRAGRIALKRRAPRGFARALGGVLARFRSAPPVTRAAVLGLSTTLLPCGWLYAFAALASATGSAGGGVLLMGVFWLGTVPILLGVGVSLDGAARRFASALSRLRPLLILGVGSVTLVSRVELSAFAAASDNVHGAASHLPTTAECRCHAR